MAGLRSLAAVAALTFVGQVSAWNVDLPPCVSPFRPFVYAGCFSDPSNPDALSFRSTLNSQNMTVELCMAECKGNGYRYAGLEYYGECFCGQTVNGAVLDDSQCSYPCTGNKSQMCGGSDIISVYQDPTFLPLDEATVEDYVPLGCYSDESNIGRTLSYPMDNVNENTMTTQSCLTACKNGGYPFAGTEYGGQCWCGVVIGNFSTVLEPSACAMPCKGDSSQICGDRGKLSLYVAKDLESLEPCGYVPPSSSSSTSKPPSTSSTSTSTSSTKPTYPPTTTSTSCTTTSKPTSTSTKPPTTTPKTSTSTSCTTTSKMTTTSKPTTSTTSSSALCTSTIVTQPPKCEYGCGKWCANELPDWNDNTGCYNGHSHCKLQVSDCFKNAGWPDSLQCFDFSSWCGDISSYCGATKRGKCSKTDCFGRRPPKGGHNPPPSTTTTVVPCVPTTTSKPPKPTTSSTTTSKCPIPTPTGICKPVDNPVGGIEAPIVTCNDIKEDFNAGNCFKLYSNKDSRKCGSYPRPQCSNACADACKIQFDECSATYVQGCKGNDGSGPGAPGSPPGNKWWWKKDASYFDFVNSPIKRTFGWTDNWNQASQKCTTQYQNCLNINRYVNVNGKCYGYGQGW